MHQVLQEFCDSRGQALRVDRAAGVIRGIKILGLTSRNGREYAPAALARAVPLYEGAKVNVNHPAGNPQAPRGYEERIGMVRNVRHEAGVGLFADLHFNPKHALAEQLAWDAQHAPENVGFSHNVQAQVARRGEVLLVEQIVRVHSVDLVADPATTRGLFESVADESHESLAVVDVPRDRLAAVAATACAANTLDATTVPPQADAASAAKRNAVAAANSPEVNSPPDLYEQLCREQAAEIARLRQAVDVRARPQSRDQHVPHEPAVRDGKSFARAVWR